LPKELLPVLYSTLYRSVLILSACVLLWLPLVSAHPGANAAPSFEATATIAQLARAVPLKLGQTVRGTISKASGEKNYTFEVPAKQDVVLTLQSRGRFIIFSAGDAGLQAGEDCAVSPLTLASDGPVYVLARVPEHFFRDSVTLQLSLVR
jgi:hypothetical protein